MNTVLFLSLVEFQFKPNVRVCCVHLSSNLLLEFEVIVLVRFDTIRRTPITQSFQYMIEPRCSLKIQSSEYNNAVIMHSLVIYYN